MCELSTLYDKYIGNMHKMKGIIIYYKIKVILLLQSSKAH